jgi:hypothetical protein
MREETRKGIKCLPLFAAALIFGLASAIINEAVGLGLVAVKAFA